MNFGVDAGLFAALEFLACPRRAKARLKSRFEVVYIGVVKTSDAKGGILDLNTIFINY